MVPPGRLGCGIVGDAARRPQSHSRHHGYNPDVIRSGYSQPLPARRDATLSANPTSNRDWASPSDPEARIAKLKDGRTHLAYKPEHAVDLGTGAIVAAEIHPADQGDTTTLPATLATAEANLAAVDAAPT